MKNEPKPTESKRQIVSEMSEKMAKAGGVFLTEYRGLTVADLTRLRTNLRRMQGELKVLQNRLAKIGFKNTAGAEPLARYMKGPTAAVFAYGDPISVAKAVRDFAGEKELFKIKAGLVSGRFLEAQDVARLADMPSRETLIGQLAGLLSSPMRRLVTVLSQPQRGLVQVLSQVAKKKS